MMTQTHFLSLIGIRWWFRMGVRAPQGLPEPIERLSPVMHLASGIGFVFLEDCNWLIILVRVTAGDMFTWFDYSDHWWSFSFLGGLGRLGSILFKNSLFLGVAGALTSRD